MKRSILLALIFLSNQLIYAQTNPITLYRTKALSVIRDFRDENSKPSGESNRVYDSLSNSLTNMINSVKTLNDTQQLKVIEHYFSLQKEMISDSNLFKSKRDREEAISEVNKDILFKLSTSNDTSLHLEGSFHFANEISVTITAFIDGKKQNTGVYRLCWAPFHGEAIELLMNHPCLESSNNFSNPYKLSIILPARFITFWLVNTQTNTLYRPDIPFKDLIEVKDSIDVAFKKL